MPCPSGAMTKLQPTNSIGTVKPVLKSHLVPVHQQPAAQRRDHIGDLVAAGQREARKGERGGLLGGGACGGVRRELGQPLQQR